MKRTIRKSFFNCAVNRSAREFLQFQITANGPTATFAFASQDDSNGNHETYFQASGFAGHPKTNYDRQWPLPGDRVIAPTAICALTFGFLGATKYTLLVELRDANNTVVSTIKDIDYERDDQTDVFSELFQITVL